MPPTPEPDDIVARAFGATVRVHEMTAGELQAAQDRALNLVTAAVFAFCAFPGPTQVKRVKEAMSAYQIAWMHGRERPKPADPAELSGWRRGDHATNRITGKYLGWILSFDMAESGAEAARMSLIPHMVIPLTDLALWTEPPR